LGLDTSHDATRSVPRSASATATSATNKPVEKKQAPPTAVAVVAPGDKEDAKAKRAERFGLPPSQDDLKQKRAAR
jgi:hypothetical protein